eukprot:scaffold61381_cov33-Tisochrysis_lutea.AAC.5
MRKSTESGCSSPVQRRDLHLRSSALSIAASQAARPPHLARGVTRLRAPRRGDEGNVERRLSQQHRGSSTNERDEVGQCGRGDEPAPFDHFLLEEKDQVQHPRADFGRSSGQSSTSNAHSGDHPSTKDKDGI